MVVVGWYGQNMKEFAQMFRHCFALNQGSWNKMTVVESSHNMHIDITWLCYVLIIS